MIARCVAGLLACTALLAACDDFSHRSALDERSATALTGGNPRVGKSTIEQMGCGGCHSIRGVRAADGRVGPVLNGIAERTYIAGVISNTPNNMVRWLVDPKSVDPLTAMPKLGLTSGQARDIAAYLYTLRD